MIRYYAATQKGWDRKKNEDRVMVNGTTILDGTIRGEDENQIIAVVCDGVGKEKHGDIAAEITALGWIYYDWSSVSENSIKDYIEILNQKVLKEQKKLDNGSKMSTTLAGVYIYDNQMLYFNVGDSRIYEINNQGVKIVSIDQRITAEEMSRFGFPIFSDSLLISYIGGTGMSCDPHVGNRELKGDCFFLICSDGLYKSIRESDLYDILATQKTLGEKGKEILNNAIKNGVGDDKSIVLIEYLSE